MTQFTVFVLAVGVLALYSGNCYATDFQFKVGKSKAPDNLNIDAKEQKLEIATGSQVYIRKYKSPVRFRKYVAVKDTKTKECLLTIVPFRSARKTLAQEQANLVAMKKSKTGVYEKKRCYKVVNRNLTKYQEKFIKPMFQNDCSSMKVAYNRYFVARSLDAEEEENEPVERVERDTTVQETRAAQVVKKPRQCEGLCVHWVCNRNRVGGRRCCRRDRKTKKCTRRCSWFWRCYQKYSKIHVCRG